MPVKLLTEDEVVLVTKPWGWERWLTPKGAPYVLKEIFIRAPHRSSLQVHLEKTETCWITNGKGFLHLHKIDMDPSGWPHAFNVRTAMNEIIRTTHKVAIYKGTVFHVEPGEIHRVEALTDLTLIEASTPQVDDVIRLQDDSGREDGRIESEHK